MAEYRRHSVKDLRAYTYWYNPPTDVGCRSCKKTLAEMDNEDNVYTCCVSRRRRIYHIYCETCWLKREAKKSGDGADSGLNAYDTGAVAKACKALRMKLLVEKQEEDARLIESISVLVDKTEDVDNFNYTYGNRDPLAMMIYNFPVGMSLLASGRLKGNRTDPSQYDKHRLTLFVRLAQRLKPFLPKVTGMMLNRLYLAQREELHAKFQQRGANRAWLKAQENAPLRLFPITCNEQLIAKWLTGKLPKGMVALAPKGYGRDATKEACAQLGIPDKERNRECTVELEVYNLREGPRFIIRY
jgi:hypothetical protein